MQNIYDLKIDVIFRIREHGQEFLRPCELEPKPTLYDYDLEKYNLKDYGIKV
jgi:hypothetical protein